VRLTDGLDLLPHELGEGLWVQQGLGLLVEVRLVGRASTLHTHANNHDGDGEPSSNTKQRDAFEYEDNGSRAIQPHAHEYARGREKERRYERMLQGRRGARFWGALVGVVRSMHGSTASTTALPHKHTHLCHEQELVVVPGCGVQVYLGRQIGGRVHFLEHVQRGHLCTQHANTRDEGAGRRHGQVQGRTTRSGVRVTQEQGHNTKHRRLGRGRVLHMLMRVTIPAHTTPPFLFASTTPEYPSHFFLFHGLGYPFVRGCVVNSFPLQNPILYSGIPCALVKLMG
jgi:hypothetical protein